MPGGTRSACSACRERGGKQERTALMDGSGGSDVEVGVHGSWADVLALPKLPRPDYCAMRGEACCGNSLVLFLIFLFVAPMQSYASVNQGKLTFTQQLWMLAIYTEAATAIVCLLGLMWGDPGTVKRTAENCFPQPEVVAEKLRNGKSLANVGNIAEDGRVYYRPADPYGGAHYAPPPPTHHVAPPQMYPAPYAGSPPFYGSPPTYGTPPYGYYAAAPPLASSPPLYVQPQPQQRRSPSNRRKNSPDNPLPIFPAADLKGRVASLCRDQHGSRFLQAHLEDPKGDSAERDLIFAEVLPRSRELATDVFGNYVSDSAYVEATSV